MIRTIEVTYFYSERLFENVLYVPAFFIFIRGEMFDSSLEKFIFQEKHTYIRGNSSLQSIWENLVNTAFIDWKWRKRPEILGQFLDMVYQNYFLVITQRKSYKTKSCRKEVEYFIEENNVTKNVCRIGTESFHIYQRNHILVS